MLARVHHLCADLDVADADAKALDVLRRGAVGDHFRNVFLCSIHAPQALGTALQNAMKIHHDA